MSIKLRLFLILILATGTVWLSAVLWIERSTRTEVERVLDARLAESANMVSSLVSDQKLAARDPDARSATISLSTTANYSRQLSCQIWSLRGDLISASSGAPGTRLAQEDGFSTNKIDGELWRVYSVHNDALGVRVMVGDRITVRDRLVYDVLQGLLIPGLVIVPVLALLIWISAGRGLAPLDRLKVVLRTRSPTDLSPLPDGPAPREIRPVRQALDRLFSELDRVRQTERDFTAFAAHELKTPLAGLRAQAQIARMAQDITTRDHALKSMIASVDRTDHMVRQLLELVTIETEEAKCGPLSLQVLCVEIEEELSPLASTRNISLHLHIPVDTQIFANHFLLFAALRNVIENAILASPDASFVTIEAIRSEGTVWLTVADQGTGIAPEDRDRISERFYRGRQAATGGSGLGLAIASAAMQRMGGILEFDHEGPGLRVRLRMNAA